MKIRIKKLDEMAQIPSYSKLGDAGMDLVAISKNVTEDYIEYGTGLAIEIPKGYVGLLFPRSSISKTDLILANSVGVIDSGYRGEIKFRFKKVQSALPDPFGISPAIYQPENIYHISDKIGQLIILPYPSIVLELVDNLEDSDRGAQGFGSTGN